MIKPLQMQDLHREQEPVLTEEPLTKRGLEVFYSAP